jgi:hypothetical protein
MVIQINSRIIDIVNNLIHIRLKKTLTGISTIIGSSSRFFLSQHGKAVLYIGYVQILSSRKSEKKEVNKSDNDSRILILITGKPIKIRL